MKGFVLIFACAMVLNGQTKPVGKPPQVPPARSAAEVVTTCTLPTPTRGPSLMLAGTCAKNYLGMKGKDGKVLYCVNTKPSPPPECKTAAYTAPKAPPPAKKK